MKPNYQIYTFDTLSSSNDYAKAHIDNLPDKSVIYCKQQKNGRGRFQRVWESERDLTFSIIYHQETDPMLFPLAIIKALQHFHIQAMIKWPNDIMIQDKKVCGILIERVFEGSLCKALIVGIGINVHPPKQDLRSKACHVDVNAMDLLQQILYSICELMECDADLRLKMYEKYHYLQGRKIQLDGVSWYVEGIHKDGYLILRNKKERRLLNSEEVSLSQVYQGV